VTPCSLGRAQYYRLCDVGRCGNRKFPAGAAIGRRGAVAAAIKFFENDSPAPSCVVFGDSEVMMVKTRRTVGRNNGGEGQLQDDPLCIDRYG
jgi:hypothetical protein